MWSTTRSDSGAPQVGVPAHDPTLDTPVDWLHNRPGFKAWEEWLLSNLKSKKRFALTA